MKVVIQEREMILGADVAGMCHASNLLVSGGTILCAWFGGSVEGAEDVDIWMSIKEGGKWCPPFIISDEKGVHWNPVFFKNSNGEIFLFYKLGKDIKTWKTMVKRSFDNGKTFSKAMELVTGDAGGRGPVRNKPVLLQNGYIAAPASLENGIWNAFVDVSCDGGTTWEKSMDIYIENLEYKNGERIVSETETDIPVSEQSFYGRGVIQPTLWTSGNSNVHMLLRSTEGYIYRSDSNDYARSWTGAYPTDLPNNNSGIDLVKVSENFLLLVYNPVGKSWGSRSPVSVAFSGDNGKVWTKLFDLDSGEGEFSYPAIVSDGDKVYISYTWKRKNIAFWTLKIEK